MPLTTRPRSTSRQGMIRLASICVGQKQNDRYYAIACGKAAWGAFYLQRYIGVLYACRAVLLRGFNRFLQCEAPSIERFAYDHRINSVGLELAEPCYIIERRYASGRSYARARCHRDFASQLYMRSFEF